VSDTWPVLTSAENSSGRRFRLPGADRVEERDGHGRGLHRKALAHRQVGGAGSRRGEEEPAVRRHLTDGDDLANQAQDQEQEGKVVLDRLDKLAPADEEFEARLTEFISAGRAHIQFEETIVWPGLRAALTAAEADDLGRELQEGKQTAPTRPHPHTPALPGLLKTAGPAVAAADRLRDTVTGRDK
jgi:hypothetical protein